MSTAAVRMVCGSCGAGVSRGDAVCRSCGATLQFGSEGSGVVCPACGHRNDPAGDFCQSCGARLVPGAGVKKEPPAGERQRKKKQQSGGQAMRQTEPWMYVAGASIIALLAYVVYLALQSPSTRPSSGGAVSPALPAGSVAAAGGGEHIAALEQAVRDRPGDADARLALANGLHDHREWGRAIEEYTQYLRKNPGNADARVDMGICYFELSRSDPAKGEENFARAVSEMETALDRSPGHVPAAFNLGMIYLQKGEIQKSNEWLRRTVAMDKNHPLAQRAQRMLEQHSFTN